MRIDWGDGSDTEDATVDSEREFTAAHDYGEAGRWAIEVCATDDAGDTGCTVVEAETGDAPVVGVRVEVDAPEAVPEGSPLTLEGTVATLDDPDADGWDLVVDWGDGSDPDEVHVGATFALEHVYTDDGTWQVTATATDGDTTDTGHVVAVVTNAEPTVRIEAATDELDVQLHGFFDDPGIEDALTATIDWGDGTVEATDVDERVDGEVAVHRFTHTYAAEGTYQVEVCVADADGARSCETSPVTVLAAMTQRRRNPPIR